MSSLQWRTINPDFSGSGKSLSNAISATSQAGSIFDALGSRLETERNNRVNNQIDLQRVAIAQDTNAREQEKHDIALETDMEISMLDDMLSSAVADNTRADGTVNYQGLAQAGSLIAKSTNTSGGSNYATKFLSDAITQGQSSEQLNISKGNLMLRQEEANQDKQNRILFNQAFTESNGDYNTVLDTLIKNPDYTGDITPIVQLRNTQNKEQQKLKSEEVEKMATEIYTAYMANNSKRISEGFNPEEGTEFLLRQLGAKTLEEIPTELVQALEKSGFYNASQDAAEHKAKHPENEGVFGNETATYDKISKTISGRFLKEDVNNVDVNNATNVIRDPIISGNFKQSHINTAIRSIEDPDDIIKHSKTLLDTAHNLDKRNPLLFNLLVAKKSVNIAQAKYLNDFYSEESSIGNIHINIPTGPKTSEQVSITSKKAKDFINSSGLVFEPNTNNIPTEDLNPTDYSYGLTGTGITLNEPVQDVLQGSSITKSFNTFSNDDLKNILDSPGRSSNPSKDLLTDLGMPKSNLNKLKTKPTNIKLITDVMRKDINKMDLSTIDTSEEMTELLIALMEVKDYPLNLTEVLKTIIKDKIGE